MKNLLIGLLVVAALVGVVVFFQKSRDGVSENDTNTAGQLVGENAVNVGEQAVGNEVNVSMVVLEKAGYVMIHKMANGVPGQGVGVSALLPKGQSQNVKVSLIEPLMVGQSYGAMLHLDDGDEVFDIGKDAPAADTVSGGPIMMEFGVSATGEPAGVSI